MIYSPPDIALILGIALLVFGPKRLPELGQAIGQGIGNFKKSMTEVESSARAAVATATSVPVASVAATPTATVPVVSEPATPNAIVGETLESQK